MPCPWHFMDAGVAHVNASKNAKTTLKVKAVNAKTTKIQRRWQRNLSAPKSRSLNYEIAGKASWTSVGGWTLKAGDWCKFVVAWFDLHSKFYLS